MVAKTKKSEPKIVVGTLSPIALMRKLGARPTNAQLKKYSKESGSVKKPKREKPVAK